MSGKALVVMFVFSVTFNGVFGNPLPDLEGKKKDGNSKSYFY